ncbi:MAG: amidohydrolase, partial [Planctomycetaceae bacterium]
MKVQKNRACSLPQGASADLILWGGNIITLDPRKPFARAVAVKNGRFLRAGSDEEARALAGSKTRRVDLRGRTVTPGFIDSHQHLSQYGTDLLQIDCSPRRCKTIGDIQKAVLQETRRKPPGEWVRGVGYDDTKTQAGKPLTRWDLDEAAPGHPVFIQHISGHWGVVNSKALEAGGIREDSPDPTGGAYGRDPATGRLNGILYEQAEFAFVFEGTTGQAPIIPPFSLKDRIRGIRLAANRYLAS